MKLGCMAICVYGGLLAILAMALVGLLAPAALVGYINSL